MILVYCNHITERHRFIFRLILEEILGREFNLTENKDEFHSFHGAKFSYGMMTFGDYIHFQAHNLLSETGIREQQIKISNWKDLPVFFQVNDTSTWPFDPFAMSFYLVSRYEEYLPFAADEHGRFTAEQSIAYREDFLDIPLVDLIALELKKMLSEAFPGLTFPERKFRFIPTFDVDIAYAHLGKGLTRAPLALLKLLLNGELKQIRERSLVVMKKMPDPYDNFDLHSDLAQKYDHAPIYFLLLGDFGKHDRNISYRNRRFRELIMRLSLSAETGIHPSYSSYLDTSQFRKEKGRLEEISGKPVIINRFHYLRMKFPVSYQIISALGIQDDYSMGYSNINGFRASTCSHFHFYDLQQELISKLRIHPFIFMDTAMIDHLKYNPEQAKNEITMLIEKVRKTGGEAIGIWHNYSLSEKDQYKGWRDVLISTLSRYKTPSR